MNKTTKTLVYSSLGAILISLIVLGIFISTALIIELHFEEESYMHFQDEVLYISLITALPTALCVGLLFFILYSMHSMVERKDIKKITMEKKDEQADQK